MFIKHYAPNRYEPRIEVIVKMGVRPGGMGERFEDIVKMQKHGGWIRPGRIRMDMNQELDIVKMPKKVRGCQGGCERRIEVIMKVQNKKNVGGSGGGVGVGGWRLAGAVRVDMNQELVIV